MGTGQGEDQGGRPRIVGGEGKEIEEESIS